MHNRWTALEEYEDYEITPQGDIRHIRYQKPLNHNLNQRGHPFVNIRNSSEGRTQSKSVAQLVAETFLSRVGPGLDSVIHRDGDFSNVNVENLAWGTRSHAICYHKEIVDPRFREYRPILEAKTNREYGSLYEAAYDTLAIPSAIDYALRYNSQLATNEHYNFVQKTAPAGYVFRPAVI